MQKHLERQRRRVLQEIGTFRLVEDHPNAVRVLEVFEGADCYYVVMECCEGGELFDHISKKASGVVMMAGPGRLIRRGHVRAPPGSAAWPAGA